MKNASRRLLGMTLVIVASIVGATTGAQAQGGGLPAIHTQGDVSYTSGGVGMDESQALKREAPDWPLALQFTGQGGDYMADVHVSITKPGGAKVLDVTSQGPFMLVKLPAGRYTIHARYKQETQERVIDISRHASVAFHWNEQ